MDRQQASKRIVSILEIEMDLIARRKTIFENGFSEKTRKLVVVKRRFQSSRLKRTFSRGEKFFFNVPKSSRRCEIIF